MKQVKIISEVMSNPEKSVNEYLQSLPKCPDELIEIQSHYNTILGGIEFVIIHPKF